jgi:hypothetical protein
MGTTLSTWMAAEAKRLRREAAGMARKDKAHYASIISLNIAHAARLEADLAEVAK